MEPIEIRLQGLIFTQGSKRFGKNACGGGIRRHDDAVVHPLAFAAGGDEAGAAQIGEMARDFGLAEPENFNEITDADLAAPDEVEEAEPGAVRQGREEQREIVGLWRAGHFFIIYGLTDVSSGEYIRLSVYKERTMSTGSGVQEQVKAKYGSVARAVAETGSVQACCDPGLKCCDPITANLYSADQKGLIPEKAVLASLGCGNPTALIELRAGETVLDLGSGGGIDVLLSAKRVGPTGKAYGLDMTDEMLALARENQKRAGVENVEFLKGEIENIPLPDNTVDVIISNCVINLSADKSRVLKEAFRVLKPGGRFAVSDVVTRGDVPAEVRKSMLLWVGCIAGAMDEAEYVAKLEGAGFKEISIEPTREYDVEDARQFLTEAGVDVDAIAPLVHGKFYSGFVRAAKPKAACCQTGCCA